jgi:hypothetical protein
LVLHQGPAHEGLEDREKHAGVGGHPALLAQGIGFEADQGIVFEGGEAGEAGEGLIGEVVAIDQKQEAGPADGLAGEIPAGLEQLPEDLKRNRGFACAVDQGEQDAVAAATSISGSRAAALMAGPIRVRSISEAGRWRPKAREP